MSKITHVIKRSGARVIFRPLRITNAIYRAAIAVGGRDKKQAERLTKQVVDIVEKKFSKENPPHVEEIQDIVEQVLIKNGHDKVAKAYILYRNEQNRKREERNVKLSHPSMTIPWSKLWEVLDWAVSHDLDTIAKMNSRIKKGEFPHIVHESESAYENDIDRAAELLLERPDTIKLVLITGPSSSGKTTTTIKLEQRLEKRGLSFVTLNVDNYFFDLAMHPKDEFGDYDFETPQALDLPLINEHISQLCDGKEVTIPFYDFKTGTRHLNRTKLQLENHQILLIDSLHGLYPQMTSGIEDERKFKLYLEPLMQMKTKNGDFIRWTDLRLIRRMLRDSLFRAYKPHQTLEHWHYVRSSEKRNILPYINTSDCIINSAMPYEIALYAARLLKDFQQWDNKFKNDPLKEDAYKRAHRALKFLSEVIPVADDSSVPVHSVLREFIGGSKLKY
ncbi:MAG TPA: response regulator SirA [Candidatus Cloacimonetes bacterium]|nr:response regulator SirA [Candidatus Cloacimonadota bacterium]HEX37620.1 response regulator SirA [Candidatus Cloacimonadota bacterium]